MGSLPGTQSEANVALLPEESAHPQYDSGAIDTRAQVNLKPSEESKGNEASFGAARHVAGVGALVGDRSEEGVARLPDEQGKQDVKPSTTSEKAPVPPMKDIPAAKHEVHPSGNKDLPNKVSFVLLSDHSNGWARTMRDSINYVGILALVASRLRPRVARSSVTRRFTVRRLVTSTPPCGLARMH